jgi:hypothetical protein
MYLYRFEIIIFSWCIMILSYEEWNYLNIVANNNYDGFSTLQLHIFTKKLFHYLKRLFNNRIELKVR